MCQILMVYLMENNWDEETELIWALQLEPQIASLELGNLVGLYYSVGSSEWYGYVSICGTLDEIPLGARNLKFTRIFGLKLFSSFPLILFAQFINVSVRWCHPLTTVHNQSLS